MLLQDLDEHVAVLVEVAHVVLQHAEVEGRREEAPLEPPDVAGAARGPVGARVSHGYYA